MKFLDDLRREHFERIICTTVYYSVSRDVS